MTIKVASVLGGTFAIQLAFNNDRAVEVKMQKNCRADFARQLPTQMVSWMPTFLNLEQGVTYSR
jgi:hypothetical protein